MAFRLYYCTFALKITRYKYEEENIIHLSWQYMQVSGS